jgi:hypothetical protein
MSVGGIHSISWSQVAHKLLWRQNRQVSAFLHLQMPGNCRCVPVESIIFDNHCCGCSVLLLLQWLCLSSRTAELLGINSKPWLFVVTAIRSGKPLLSGLLKIWDKRKGMATYLAVSPPRLSIFQGDVHICYENKSVYRRLCCLLLRHIIDGTSMKVGRAVETLAIVYFPSGTTRSFTGSN